VVACNQVISHSEGDIIALLFTKKKTSIKEIPFLKQYVISTMYEKIDSSFNGVFILDNPETKLLYQVGLPEDEPTHSDKKLPKHVVIGKNGTIFYIGKRLEQAAL
jgi:hypothetical protein